MQFMKYQHKKSKIHTAKPEIKLISSTIIALISLISSNITTQILVFTILISAQHLSKISKKQFYNQFKFLKILAPIIILLNGFFHTGPILLTIFNYTFTTTGILMGFTIMLRVLNISFSYLLFANTTTAIDMAKSLVSFKIPKDTAFTLILTIRNIPLVKRDIDLVQDSMKSRGIDFKGIRGVKNIYLMFLPVLTSILERAERQAIALEVKGFDTNKLLD